ncbi:MAG TPA: hypothetical protein P5277_05200 [Candidatus Paceibacterota bacterium]|nr:hypothetical protein [Candidatus Paceibacterota bacterium]
MQNNIFLLIDMLDKEFPDYIFGANQDGMLFINAQMTNINLNTTEEIGIASNLSQDQIYQELKKFLIKNKLIKE